MVAPVSGVKPDAGETEDLDELLRLLPGIESVKYRDPIVTRSTYQLGSCTYPCAVVRMSKSMLREQAKAGAADIQEYDVKIARRVEALALGTNPLVITTEGPLEGDLEERVKRIQEQISRPIYNRGYTLCVFNDPADPSAKALELRYPPT